MLQKAIALAIAGAAALPGAASAANSMDGKGNDVVTTRLHDTAEIRPGGTHLTIGGPLSCAAGRTIEIHVVVLQEAAPLGDGESLLPCPDSPGEWWAVLPVWGAAPATGAAHATAWARVYEDGRVVRSWGWENDVRLRPAATE